MLKAVEDPILGHFEWDDELRYWRGSLALPSRRSTHLDITPATDEHSNCPEGPGVFAAAYPVVEWLRASEDDAYRVVSEAMLEMYNGAWSEEPPITAEEFAARIELVTVDVPSDGERFSL